MARDLDIQITADSQQAEQALGRVEQGMRLVESQSERTGRAVDEAGKLADRSIARLEKKWEDQAKAAEKATEAAKKQGSAIGDLEKLAMRYAGPAAIGLAITRTLQYADSISTLAKQSRMSVESVQTLGFVAERNGASFQTVASAIVSLDATLAKGSERTKTVLKDLGFTINDLLRLSPENRFRELAFAIGSLESESERALAAISLFGPGGKALLATFDSIAAGAERDAPRMSTAWVEAMDEVNTAWQNAKRTGMDLVRSFFGMGVMMRKFMMDMDQLGRDTRAGMASNMPALPLSGLAGPAPLATPDPFAADGINGLGLDYWERELARRYDAIKPRGGARVLPFVRPERMGESDWNMSAIWQAQQFNLGVPGLGPGSFPGWAPLASSPFGPMAGYAGTVPMNRPGLTSSWLSGAGGRFLGAGLGMATNFLPGISHAGAGIGSGLGGALGGLKSVTGALGSFAPFLGPIMGIAGGLLGKLFGPSEADKARDKRNAFVDDFGGMGSLRAAASTAGVSLDGLMNAKKVADVEKEVRKLTEALDAFDKKIADANRQMSGLLDQGRALGFNFSDSGELISVSFEKMQEKAKQYGLDLQALGPAFEQQRLHAAASEIINDFDLLTRGGASVGTVLSGMSDEISALVNDSVKFGVAIPANMQPWIEELMRTQQLTDENGVALTDLSTLKFADPIVTEFDKLVKKMDELITSMQGFTYSATNGFTAAKQAAQSYGETVVNLPEPGVSEHYSMGGFVGMPKYLSGGGFLPRGTDTVPAMLTPGEGVMTRQAVSRLMRGDWPQGGSGVTITIDSIVVQGGGDEAAFERRLGRAMVDGARRRGVRLNAA